MHLIYDRRSTSLDFSNCLTVQWWKT